jgi:hypothetical protein
MPKRRKARQQWPGAVRGIAGSGKPEKLQKSRKGTNMPEFKMNGVQEPDFQALDEFTQGYIEAMFFTECGGSKEDGTFDPENGSQLPDEAGFYDIAPDALADIAKDCAKFQADNKDLLEQSYKQETNDSYREYTPERAGHDYWFTRQGHGVGYWDRGFGELGDSLSAAAKKTGEAYVTYGDDGKVYHQ